MGENSADTRTNTLVAASLLRWGSDTKPSLAVVRLLSAGLDPTGPSWLIRLAQELAMAQPERRASRAIAEAGAAMDAASKAGIAVVSILDDGYPPWLRHIADPPIVLWVAGARSALERPAPFVAVVGSRNATPIGAATARRLGRDLARAGLVVVSGLARGIDGAAHHGALDGGGVSIGVLGTGADVIYPSQNRALGLALMERGALISEFPPGARPYASHFPLRNRIISGLSRAVVIVEASDKSGSLITARLALEQGRDVLAVPGSIASGCYRGCHSLIKDGARLVETVDDILDEIGWARTANEDRNCNPDNYLASLIQRGEALGLDELAARTGRAAPDLLAELGGLELAGKVARMPGGLFIRLD